MYFVLWSFWRLQICYQMQDNTRRTIIYFLFACKSFQEETLGPIMLSIIHIFVVHHHESTLIITKKEKLWIIMHKTNNNSICFHLFQLTFITKVIEYFYIFKNLLINSNSSVEEKSHRMVTFHDKSSHVAIKNATLSLHKKCNFPDRYMPIFHIMQMQLFFSSIHFNILFYLLDKSI